MWKRFSGWLRCPLCKGPHELSIEKASATRLSEEHQALAKQRDVFNDDFAVLHSHVPERFCLELVTHADFALERLVPTIMSAIRAFTLRLPPRKRS